jgi:hypothetical protein
MLQDSPLHPLGRGGPHFVRPDLSAAAGMLASKTRHQLIDDRFGKAIAMANGKPWWMDDRS